MAKYWRNHLVTLRTTYIRRSNIVRGSQRLLAVSECSGDIKSGKITKRLFLQFSMSHVTTLFRNICSDFVVAGSFVRESSMVDDVAEADDDEGGPQRADRKLDKLEQEWLPVLEAPGHAENPAPATSERFRPFCSRMSCQWKMFNRNFFA